MIVDSSALVAMLRAEPGADEFGVALARAGDVRNLQKSIDLHALLPSIKTREIAAGHCLTDGSSDTSLSEALIPSSW